MKTPGTANNGNQMYKYAKNFCAMDYYWLLTWLPLMGDSISPHRRIVI
jgi:hypothetical protein